MRRQDARNSRSLASLGMRCCLVRDRRIGMGRDMSKPAPFKTRVRHPTAGLGGSVEMVLEGRIC